MLGVAAVVLAYMFKDGRPQARHRGAHTVHQLLLGVAALAFDLPGAARGAG